MFRVVHDLCVKRAKREKKKRCHVARIRGSQTGNDSASEAYFGQCKVSLNTLLKTKTWLDNLIIFNHKIFLAYVLNTVLIQKNGYENKGRLYKFMLADLL